MSLNFCGQTKEKTKETWKLECSLFFHVTFPVFMDITVYLGACESPCLAFTRLAHHALNHRLEEREGVLTPKCVMSSQYLSPNHNP